MSQTTTTRDRTQQLRPFGTQPDVEIAIGFEDLMKYRYLVQEVKPNEVQWYSMVERVIIPASKRAQHHKKDLYVYYVYDMVIPEQEVSRGAVDTDVRKDPMKMYRLMKEIEDRYPDETAELGFDVEKANADMQSMHVWCHSHPFTDFPWPSGTDDRQFEEWVTENQISQGIDTPMVALIFGSGEHIHARLYDPRMPGVFYDNVKVAVDYAEVLDTEYMDDSIERKVKAKSYPTGFHGSSGYVRCSDGVYRAPTAAKEFEAKKKSGSQVVLKEEPAEDKEDFFAKHFDGNWDDFLRLFNSKYQNEQEVKRLMSFMGKWLHDDLERTLFAYAMTDSPEGLRKMAEGEQRDLYLCNEEEVLMVMVGHFSTDTLSSEMLKASLTFAKRYAKQKDKAGRLRAIEGFENATKTIPNQRDVWDNSNEVAGTLSVPYGFAADDDDDDPYAIALGGTLNDVNRTL
jgi:hypothetical protein